MHPTRIDIPKPTREDLVNVLNQYLADYIDTVSQLKQAHWNVKGPRFMTLHLLFDGAYEALEGQVDDVAERIATLGGTAAGTVRQAASASQLPEYPAATTGEEHLAAVVDVLATFCGLTREAIRTAAKLGEPTTEDLLTEISRAADLQLFFVESHLGA
mgnify:FL=1